MTSIVCNKFRSNLSQLDEILNMNLNIDEEHLIFLSVFLKICVSVKSSLGFSCICYISNDLEHYKYFLNSVKNKTNLILK